MGRINCCRPFSDLFPLHARSLGNAGSIARAKDIRAHGGGIIGDFISELRAQCVEAGFRVFIAAFPEMLHQHFFIGGEEIAVTGGKLAVIAIEIHAVARAHMLAVQTNDHEFAVDADALLGFSFFV